MVWRLCPETLFAAVAARNEDETPIAALSVIDWYANTAKRFAFFRVTHPGGMDILVQKIENRLFHASCGMQIACLWRHCRHKARNHVRKAVTSGLLCFRQRFSVYISYMRVHEIRFVKSDLRNRFVKIVHEIRFKKTDS